jgi:hypothetical protein
MPELRLDSSNDSVPASAPAALGRLGSAVYTDPVNKLTLIKLGL